MLNAHSSTMQAVMNSFHSMGWLRCSSIPKCFTWFVSACISRLDALLLSVSSSTYSRRASSFAWADWAYLRLAECLSVWSQSDWLRIPSLNLVQRLRHTDACSLSESSSRASMMSKAGILIKIDESRHSTCSLNWGNSSWVRYRSLLNLSSWSRSSGWLIWFWAIHHEFSNSLITFTNASLFFNYGSTSSIFAW